MEPTNNLVHFFSSNRDMFVSVCSYLDEKEVCKFGEVSRTFRDLTSSLQLWNDIGKRYGLKVTNEEAPKHDILEKIRTINSLVAQLPIRDASSPPIAATTIFARYKENQDLVRKNPKIVAPHLNKALRCGVMNLRIPAQPGSEKNLAPQREVEGRCEYETLERVRFLLLAGVQPEGLKILNEYIGLIVGRNTKKDTAAYQVEMAVLELACNAIKAKMTKEEWALPENQRRVDQMIHGMAEARDRNDIVTVLAELRPSQHPQENLQRTAKRRKTG